MGYAHRVDGNQAEVVAAFERLGFSVVDLSGVGGGVPDLLVSVHRVSVFVEVKTVEGELEPSQVRFHRESKAWIEVVRDMADVEWVARAMKREAFRGGSRQESA
jgi:Holliday junction resolvase